ncbi:GcrA family cell cycle regulator [Bosea sp. RAC05]|uniref:GcrA family cell cycle regulator n=1 Tax=Bosea sp. RAC05 TaxID=1842539 RepID=UPI00083D2E5F|nr:GcrA family cell cycle regulator [Bosea sp. RAC05]
MSWTEERENIMREMWVVERLSTSAIATKLNEMFGTELTKNSIIGKVNRLGLAYKGGARDSVAPRSTKADRLPKEAKPKAAKQPRTRETPALDALFSRPAPRPATVRQVAAPLPPPMMPETSWFGAEAVNSLFEASLEGKACKWPVGDPCEKTFRFCNTTYRGEGSYCPYHNQIAYQPGSKQRVADKAAERYAEPEAMPEPMMAMG